MDTDSPSQWALAFSAALVAAVALMAAFTTLQMDGEPPAYGCNPGHHYTTKECQ